VQRSDSHVSAFPDIAVQTRRVLIADDERHTRQLLEVMLASEGYQVDEASSGEEALALVARRPPDLILLDVLMPGMSGFEVATELKFRPATKHIPIIMVTAIDDRDARVHGLMAGAEEFLSKPVDRAELCVRVRNLLRLKAYGEYYEHYSQALEAEVLARTADLQGQAQTLSEQAALLDLTQDAVVAWDMEGRILFWSRGAEAMMGWSRHEAVGRITFELMNTVLPESLAQIEVTLLQSGRWEGEVTHQTRDGARLRMSSRWALERDAAGRPRRVLSINTDVANRKQAEAERLRLTERLSLATEVARVGVWEWDIESDTFIWDDTMFDFYGLPHGTPTPYDVWSHAVDPADLPAVEGSLREAVETKGSSTAEFRIRRPDGSLRTMSTMGRVTLNEQGTVTGVVGVQLDVTDRKASEAALKESGLAQLRFKDEFLSHVSHELRSPLTAIKQFTTILAGGLVGELTGEQLAYQQIVMRNVTQLQAMIDDLLEVTRIETGKLTVEAQDVSVVDAVTDALATLRFTARTKGVTLSADLLPHLPSAYADPTRLRQILIILLDNAIKFTGKDGLIAVAAQLLARDPSFLVISVSDNGCGISPESAAKLFERLYQAPGSPQATRKGFGLGLYISKELVTLQGGDIWVDSTPGKGSTFSFTLPVFGSALKKLIAPLLTNDRWPTETAALVVVSAGPAAGSSAQPTDPWLTKAAAVVHRCLLPDRDVLLPTVRSPGAGARFNVVAFADETGAAILVRRIQVQLERHLADMPAGPVTSVSYRMLPAGSPGGDRAVADRVAAMAAMIEEAMKAGAAGDRCIAGGHGHNT
jgi:PAS domain S-box-containing protein